MAEGQHKLAIFRGLLKFKSNQQKIWGVLIFLSIVSKADTAPMSEAALRGLEIAQEHCSRCHVGGNENRYSSIETTPSFFGLRAMKDWRIRFTEFYIRPPHPALVNIVDVTERSKKLPAFVSEINLKLDQIDDLISYLEQLKKID